MSKDRWIVDRSCFDDAVQMRPNPMGGRPVALTAATSQHGVHEPDMTCPCVVVLPLPARYRRRRTVEGNVVFSAANWWSVAASAFGFAQTVDPDVPRFGIKFPDDDFYRWWDGTSEEDRLAGPDASDYLRPWLERIYPDATAPIQIIDQRTPPSEQVTNRP